MSDRCQSVQHALIPYIHDELPAAQRRAVTLHIHECEACYAAYRKEQQLAHQASARFSLAGTPTSDKLDQLKQQVHIKLQPASQVQPASAPAWPSWTKRIAVSLLLISSALPWTLTFNELSDVLQIAGATPVVEPLNATPDGTTVAHRTIYSPYAFHPVISPAAPTATSTPAAAPIPEVTQAQNN